MKDLEKKIKEMKSFGIQMLILGVTVCVLGIYIDQNILNFGSGILLFIGIDMISKSNKLKKQQEEAED